LWLHTLTGSDKTDYVFSDEPGGFVVNMAMEHRARAVAHGDMTLWT
jgi:hypothetical protein